MSTILVWSIAVAQVLLGLAMAVRCFPHARGPRAQDRVVGVRLPIRQRHAAASDLRYPVRQHALFEAALVIALLGFVGTVALAKFLLRGEVIE